MSEMAKDFLHELDGWERAYPQTAFPEPDLKRAAEVLKANGMTLDAISASNMRHVVQFIAPKARALITSQAAEIEGLRLSRLRAEEFGDAAFERVKVLEKALEPFASEAENYDYGDGSGPDHDDAPDHSSLNECNDLLVGHLRAARTALQHEGGGRG